MKGISQLKAKENTIRYKTMYDKWKLGATLQEIGENYAISKQRVWQIITRCKLGDGDYYAGVDVARNNWLKFKELHGNLEKAQENYKQWLHNIDVKVTSDNRNTAPHTGLERLKI